ncbi:MAG: pyridoxal-phosphate dependent enzyme, partial [Trueperaceae bacterium]
GSLMYLLSDSYGQVSPPHSVSAGLDYPGVGPEHSYYKDSGRAEYVAVTDAQALNAFERLARSEGIIPALESAHAVAHALELAPTMTKDQVLVVNLSGRGDKDVAEVLRLREVEL